MNLVNLTPHPINILVGNKIIVISTSGIVARCTTVISDLDPIEFEGFKIPITQSLIGEIINLPERQENTMYIASILVSTKAKQLGRTDVVSPDTIRDDLGNIIGCKGFIIP
jgi:hypothetical protein